MTQRLAVFRRLAQATSRAVGTSAAFCFALVVVMAWAALGPFFHYSDTWQLVINTGTTIVTFLMIFLVQYTQNRETEAVSLKLDELIRAVDAARNEMLAVDDLDDAQLAALRVEFRQLAATPPEPKRQPRSKTERTPLARDAIYGRSYDGAPEHGGPAGPGDAPAAEPDANAPRNGRRPGPNHGAKVA
jgi:low affinity Fe/Cu permease